MMEMFDLVGKTQFELESMAEWAATPVERRGDFFVKRDDLWSEHNIAWGGKARTAGLVCRRVLAAGGRGIALALARNSSVPGMVARVCRYYGMGLQVHVPLAAAAPTK